MENIKKILSEILDKLDKEFSQGKVYNYNEYERQWYKGYLKAKKEDYESIAKYLEEIDKERR